MAVFGDKKLKEENEKLKRQLDIISKKVKRFEQNVRTGIFSVGMDADLETEAHRLEVQKDDMASFLATCKEVIKMKKAMTFTFHDGEGRRFDCEIKAEGDRINIIKRDNTVLEGIMGPRMVEKMLSKGKSVDDVYKSLKPEMTKITVMFLDLRAFTSYAEKKSPNQVAEFLSEFYEVAYPLVYESGGIVNKTLGDGLMTIFGAPYSLQGQEKAAVTVGMAVIKAWKKRVDEKLLPGVGAGVATGMCIVGNIGLKRQINYTALGDIVNTASRLAGAPAGDLWATGTTVNMCAKDFSWQKLEPMTLKGKAKPIDIFQLSG